MWWLQILVTVVICVCVPGTKTGIHPISTCTWMDFISLTWNTTFKPSQISKGPRLCFFNLPKTVNLLENIKAYWNPLIVSNFNIPSRWHPCLWNSWQMSPSPPLISLVVEISQVFCWCRRCLQNTQGVRHPPPILIFPNLISTYLLPILSSLLLTY